MQVKLFMLMRKILRQRKMENNMKTLCKIGVAIFFAYSFIEAGSIKPNSPISQIGVDSSGTYFTLRENNPSDCSSIYIPYARQSDNMYASTLNSLNTGVKVANLDYYTSGTGWRKKCYLSNIKYSK